MTEADRVFEQRERLADAILSERVADAASLMRVTGAGMTMQAPFIADLVYVTPEGARYEVTLKELEAPSHAAGG